MIPFLLVYLLVYSLLHYYILCKIRVAVPLGRRGSLVVISVMVVMILAPVVVRLAERAGIEAGARFWALLSSSWMGLLFLFMTLAVVTDGARLLVLAAAKTRHRQVDTMVFRSPKVLAAQVLLTLVVYGYGLFEAADIRIRQLEIASPKISSHQGRVRIALISDVHLGLIVRAERLSRILTLLEEAEPDILVSTGDLVDGQLNHLAAEAALLAAFKPPLGKFAITGNHEFYAGLPQALDFTEAAGFTLLRHQGAVSGGINLVGVDDPAAGYFSDQQAMLEPELLAAKARGNFTVLLKHRPDIDPGSLGLFDLQLSGHTHKGQIFPFNLLTWLFFPRRAGQLIPLSSGFLYLSPGTGTWGPPIRILAAPEVTIIDLIPGP
jgi:predicted MPP superfamily phosphohydrolase